MAYEEYFNQQLMTIAAIAFVGYFLTITNRIWLSLAKLFFTFCFNARAIPHYYLTDSLYDSVPGLKELLRTDCVVEDNVVGYSYRFGKTCTYFYSPNLEAMERAYREKALRAWREKYQISIDIETDDTIKRQLIRDQQTEEIKFEQTLRIVSNYDDVLTIVNLMGFYVLKTRSSYLVFKNFNRYKYDDYCHGYLNHLVRKFTDYGETIPTWMSVFKKEPKLVLVNTADRTCYSAVFESINTKHLNYINLKRSFRVFEGYISDNLENRNILRFEGNHRMELELLLFCVDFLYDHKDRDAKYNKCWKTFMTKLVSAKKEIFMTSVTMSLEQIATQASVMSFRNDEPSDHPLTIDGDATPRDGPSMDAITPPLKQEIVGNQVNMPGDDAMPTADDKLSTAQCVCTCEHCNSAANVKEGTLSMILSVLQEQFVPKPIDHCDDLKYNLCKTTHTLETDRFVKLEIDSNETIDALKAINHPIYVNHIKDRLDICPNSDQEKLFNVYALVYTLSKRKEESQLFKSLWFVDPEVKDELQKSVTEKILNISPYCSNPTIIVNCGKTTTFFDFGGLFEIDFITDKHCFLKALICLGLSKRVIFESMFNTFGVNKTTNILMKGTILVSDYILLLNTIRHDHVNDLTVFIAFECQNNIAYREKMVIQGKMIGMGEIRQVLLIRNGNNLDVYEYDSNFTYRNIDYLPEIELD